MGKPNKDYPRVHTWNYITIEGYCMLNIEYGRCKDRYCYELKPDGSHKRVKNPDYTPEMTPDPFPDGCKRRVSSECIECRHFAWCDPGNDILDSDERHEN